jgi:arabinan endo-1,5-alpha-L-arabinosidase
VNTPKTTSFVTASVLLLSVAVLMAQAPPAPIPAPNQPAPTAKDKAVMAAALRYYQEPNAVLYPTHDPEIIKQGDTYYLFPTGGAVSSSSDLIHWEFAYNIFEKAPDWVTDDIVGAPGSGSPLAGGGNGPVSLASPSPRPRGGRIAAPDVQLVNGVYYLFYNVTAFAKNTSAIGVATNNTLDPHSPDFHWVDHGMVVQSIPNRDMWNAIDANLVMDRAQGWLVFGSFWGGIKMVKLAPDLLSIAKPQVWFTLARQPRNFNLDDTDPGDGTIEGPFVYKHFQYFYLFVSLGYCCRGVDSDYNLVVGRSRTVEGPYVDRDGKLLSRGGGTPIAKGNADWAGVGHNSAYTMDGKSILIMHGYDKRDNGRSKLILREIKWDRGDWPSIDW